MGHGAVAEMPAGTSTPRSLRAATGLISQGWAWIQARKTARVSSRRLRVIETVSLGEKRFIAVVQVDGVSLLVGGSISAVSLLKELGPGEDSGRVSLDSPPLADVRRNKGQPNALQTPKTFGEVLRMTETKPVTRRKRSLKQTAVGA